MRLAGKHIVAVIAPRDFRDEELFVPRQLFEQDGARVTVASTRTGQCLGMRGGRAVAQQLIDTVRAGDLDALLIIGGNGAQAFLWPHRTLGEIVQQTCAQGRLVGGICLGSAVLARAGILKDKAATCWPSPEALAELRQGGALYSDAPVVQAPGIATASGPDAAGRWAEVIAALLCEAR